MTGSRPTPPLPTVVVPFGYRSLPALQLARSAEGICNLVWLVAPSDPEVEAMGRLLARLGTVVEVEGLDADGMRELLSPYEPQGVVAFRDQDLMPMAGLAERCGLRFHAPAVARRLVDKVDQRKALDSAGMPGPLWWEIPSRFDPTAVAAVAGGATYPAVVKPRQGSGSRHTFRVDDAAELVALLGTLAGDTGRRGQLSPDHSSSDDSGMILEEYLPSAPGASERQFADYVSVESLVFGDGPCHLAVTGRLHPVSPFRETGFFLPSDLSPSQTSQVLETASAALAALDVRFGCVHTEIKLTPDGPRVIEVNGRVGGGVPDLVSAASGVDLLGLQLRAALGQPVDLRGTLPCERIGYRFFYQPPDSAQRLESVGGLPEIGALPGVESVALHLNPGERIDASQGSRSFVFAVIGAAGDHAGVAETNRLMYELAEVTYQHRRTPVAERAET